MATSAPTSPAAASSKSGVPFQSGRRSMETTHRTILMLRAKVVVVGDACVGKTALVQMLKSGGHDYPKNYIMVRQERCKTFFQPISKHDTLSRVDSFLFPRYGVAAGVLRKDVHRPPLFKLSPRWAPTMMTDSASTDSSLIKPYTPRLSPNGNGIKYIIHCCLRYMYRPLFHDVIRLLLSIAAVV